MLDVVPEVMSPTATIERRDWVARSFRIWLFLLLAAVGLGGATLGPVSSALGETISETAAESIPTERLQEIFNGDEPRTLPELRALQNHVKALIAKVTPTVVGIDLGSSQGSGVVVSRDGYVLTAGHVIASPRRNAGVYFSGDQRLNAQALGINVSEDSGLVKIKNEGNWPYADMGDSDSLKPGQWVLTVAHPGGYQAERGPVVRLGRILAITSEGVKTDCVLVGGDSGGPLFDMKGQVIGINSRIGDELEKNIHVPVNAFGKSWDRLAASERWGNIADLFAPPPYMGFTVEREATEAEVIDVKSSSPAERAGLLKGDVIVEFNNIEIDRVSQLISAILMTSAGEPVKVIVLRGEERLTLSLTPEERPG